MALTQSPLPPPAARERCTVTWVADGYVHAINEWGTTYFVFHNACEQTGRYNFHDLWIGSKIELTPITHPKGPRGIEVKILEV